MASVDVSSPAELSARHPAAGREAREPSEVGRRIADRYQIEQQLREDERTITVAARHMTLEERVLIQVLCPELRFDAQRSAQYLRAAKALARIKTDHVARVLDVGVALYLGPFMVLEELQGSTLAELVGSQGPLPIPRAVEYVLQACKGLAVAHAAGIVHGQLHPSRLLLARQGEFETLKVIEFPTLELAPAERGKAYLAPELASGQPEVDRRADVWSLGAVLYELVTGRAALSPGNGAALSHGNAQQALEPDDLQADDAALSPALRAIISRCLQPDPEQRYLDVEALASELLPLTTMNEVFRGSLTGSFSRQMMMAAAAQARAAVSGQPRQPARKNAWAARLRSSWPATSLREGRERWSALALRWEERKPAGAPALQQVLGGAALLVAAVSSALLSDFALLPPPPRQQAALANTAQALPEMTAPAALSPGDELAAAQQPEAPAATTPAAAELPVAVQDELAPEGGVEGVAVQGGIAVQGAQQLERSSGARESKKRATERRSTRASSRRGTEAGGRRTEAAERRATEAAERRASRAAERRASRAAKKRATREEGAAAKPATPEPRRGAARSIR